MPQHLRVDVHLGADQGAKRWQGAQLVAAEVAAKLLLGGKASVVIAQGLAGQVQIQPARSGDDHERIAGSGAHHQRLQHLAGVDAKRARASSTDV